MTASADSERMHQRSGLRLPDFFIVGHPKSGTSALYQVLRAHPQIFMAELKEPRFFATDLRARFQPNGAGVLPETIEQYAALFEQARPGQKIGDASPSYLRSRVAAAAIADERPDALIIAILREPASFLRSRHLEMLQKRLETEPDLSRALAAEALPPVAEGVGQAQAVAAPTIRYSDQVRYVEQLRRFEEHFPASQMLVLIYDDFRADNEATIRRILRFVGVDDTVPVSAAQTNASVRVRSRLLEDLLRGTNAGANPLARALRRTTRLLPAPLRTRALGPLSRRLVYAQPPPADERAMVELRRRFRGEVEALSEHLGRDLLSLWGYDRLD